MTRRRLKKIAIEPYQAKMNEMNTQQTIKWFDNRAARENPSSFSCSCCPLCVLFEYLLKQRHTYLRPKWICWMYTTSGQDWKVSTYTTYIICSTHPIGARAFPESVCIRFFDCREREWMTSNDLVFVFGPCMIVCAKNPFRARHSPAFRQRHTRCDNFARASFPKGYTHTAPERNRT